MGVLSDVFYFLTTSCSAHNFHTIYYLVIYGRYSLYKLVGELLLVRLPNLNIKIEGLKNFKIIFSPPSRKAKENNIMTLTQKIEIIRQKLEEKFNGHVTARAAINYSHFIIVTLKLRYIAYNFSYPVSEEAIEMSEPHDIVYELDDMFMSLILNYIRRD